jgi:hypothetical protein
MPGIVSIQFDDVRPPSPDLNLGYGAAQAFDRTIHQLDIRIRPIGGFGVADLGDGDSPSSCAPT